MIINATACYQEEIDAEIRSRIKATIEVHSDTYKSDKCARVLARSLYQNMLQAMPN